MDVGRLTKAHPDLANECMKHDSLYRLICELKDKACAYDENAEWQQDCENVKRIQFLTKVGIAQMQEIESLKKTLTSSDSANQHRQERIDYLELEVSRLRQLLDD